MTIRDRDHQILNPLNNILMLAYGTPQYEEIEKEIGRVVSILVKERVITKRNRDTVLSLPRKLSANRDTV